MSFNKISFSRRKALEKTPVVQTKDEKEDVKYVKSDSNVKESEVALNVNENIKIEENVQQKSGVEDNVNKLRDEMKSKVHTYDDKLKEQAKKQILLNNAQLEANIEYFESLDKGIPLKIKPVNHFDQSIYLSTNNGIDLRVNKNLIKKMECYLTPIEKVVFANSYVITNEYSIIGEFNHVNECIKNTDCKFLCLGVVASINDKKYNVCYLKINDIIYHIFKENLTMDDLDLGISRASQEMLEMNKVKILSGGYLVKCLICEDFNKSILEPGTIVININYIKEKCYFDRLRKLEHLMYTESALIYSNINEFNVIDLKVLDYNIESPFGKELGINVCNFNHKCLAIVLKDTMYSKFLTDIYWNGEFKVMSIDELSGLVEYRHSRSYEFNIFIGSVKVNDGYKLVFIRQTPQSDLRVSLVIDSTEKKYYYVLRGDLLDGGLKGIEFSLCEDKYKRNAPFIRTDFSTVGGFMDALAVYSRINQNIILNKIGDTNVIDEEINLKRAQYFVFSNIQNFNLCYSYFDKNKYLYDLKTTLSNYVSDMVGMLPNLYLISSTGVLHDSLKEVADVTYAYHIENGGDNVINVKYTEKCDVTFPFQSTRYVDCKLLLVNNFNDVPIFVNVSKDLLSVNTNKPIFTVDVTKLFYNATFYNDFNTLFEINELLLNKVQPILEFLESIYRYGFTYANFNNANRVIYARFSKLIKFE